MWTMFLPQYRILSRSICEEHPDVGSCGYDDNLACSQKNRENENFHRPSLEKSVSWVIDSAGYPVPHHSD